MSLNAVDEPIKDRSRFWRRPFAQNVLPFLTSLTFHAGLLVFALLTYQSVKVLFQHHEQSRDAESALIFTEPLVNADGWRGAAAEGPPRQDRVPDPPAAGWSMQPGHDRKLNVSFGDPSSSLSAETVIGAIGAPASGRRDGSGAAGDGGPPAPFGEARAGGGPTIFSPPGTHRPRSIAYLCDASGSMLNKFDALRHELSRAIQDLHPNQSFAVTFFQGANCKTLDQRLLMATPLNKARAMDFLDYLTPRESTDPIPAIELAFRQKPELIFLLTDGDFPDNDAVLRKVNLLNKDHRVRISTIAFVSESDTDTAFIGLLKRIAQENRGVYKHVSESDLQ